MNENYEIEVKGHLDLDWIEWFEGFTLIHQSDGTTLLQGQVKDQPSLHGLLLRINQLGLSLLRVEQVDMETLDE